MQELRKACLLYTSMAKAAPVLLEPIMKVEITMPEEYMGDVIGDVNSRRGRIEGMDLSLIHIQMCRRDRSDGGPVAVPSQDMVRGVYQLTMHKLADYKDKKDAVAVSDKVYNDIEELKKAT